MRPESSTNTDGARDAALDPAVRCALLALVDRHRVLEVAAGIASARAVTPLEPPRAGLGMLAIREGVQGEAFNLGEFSLSRAAVALTGGSGERVEGGAVVMADDAELAGAMAVIDAAVTASLSTSATASDREVAEPARALLVEGDASRRERDRLRAAMMAATRVDFALLNRADEA